MPKAFGVGVRQPPYDESRPGSNTINSILLVNIFLSRIFTKKYFSIFGFYRPKRGWPIRIRNKRVDRSGDQLLREFRSFSGPGIRLYRSRTYQAVRGSLNSTEKMKILLNRSFIPSEFFPFRIQHFIAHHIIRSSQF